ncbi:MAG: tetratricopeptide repeat protein [Promethearchaeota archaeon]
MSNIQKIINKAKKLKDEEKYEEAIKLLEDTYQQYPQSEEIKNNYVNMLFSYGGYLNDEFVLEYEKAVEIFKKILEIEPNNFKVFYNLGIAYSNLDQVENALKAYNTAITLKPDYKHCYYNIGLLYEEKENLNMALNYYEKALEIDPNFPYAVHAGQIIRKRIDLQRHQETEPEKASVCKNCGNFNREGASFCDECGEKL